MLGCYLYNGYRWGVKYCTIQAYTEYSVLPYIRDWDETTPSSPPAERQTSSEVTPASGLISSSSSEAAPLAETHHLQPPFRRPGALGELMSLTHFNGVHQKSYK